MSSFTSNIILKKEKKGLSMSKKYDPILKRLITIITKLSNNERYTSLEFAEEFNVTTRTIQNDIYKRLYDSFPITKDEFGRFKFEDGFSLDKSMLDNNEMILLSLSLNCFNESSNFTKTTHSILQKLLYPNFFNPYYIKKEQFEDIDMNSKLVKSITTAITNLNLKLFVLIAIYIPIINCYSLLYIIFKSINLKLKSFLFPISLLSKNYNILFSTLNTSVEAYLSVK